MRRSDETAMARWCCGFALASSTIRMPPRMPSRLRFSSWRERLERSGTGNPSRVGSSVSPVGCPVGPWRSDPDGSRGRDTDSLCRRAAPGSRDSQRELLPEVHDEVARLPEKYRVPIVLCYVEGLTHEEAAGQLHLPVGTVKVRLARGQLVSVLFLTKTELTPIRSPGEFATGPRRPGLPFIIMKG